MPAQTGQAPHRLPTPSNLGDEIGAFAKYQGETVTDIEFRGIAGADPAMLRSLLAQKTNEPLDRDQLRASLQALYATDDSPLCKWKSNRAAEDADIGLRGHRKLL